MMNELNDIAGQHEMIAENIATQILSDLTQLIMSLRQDRKRVSDGVCNLTSMSHIVTRLSSTVFWRHCVEQTLMWCSS